MSIDRAQASGRVSFAVVAIAPKQIHLLANPGAAAQDGAQTMSVIRYLRDAAVFAPCYIALDWASYFHPLGAFNITPWNPQPALAIVWMLLGGLHHVPAVLATIFVAEVIVRHAPGGYAIALYTAMTLALGYAGIAWLLGWLARPMPRLRSARDRKSTRLNSSH